MDYTAVTARIDFLWRTARDFLVKAALDAERGGRRRGSPSRPGSFNFVKLSQPQTT